MRMDTHQAYCLNFVALTRRWGRGPIAILAAWELSVLAITLTVVAAWLIGRLLAIGPVPIDLDELFQLELWTAIIATILNYLRLFRFVFVDAKSLDKPIRASTNARGSGRAPFALAALFGPASLVLIIIALTY
jgi:hypothetical protein